MDWTHILSMLKAAKLYYLLPAVLFIFLSVFFSIIRFNLFIRQIGIRISFWTNVKLNFLGMFYNFFLPGGIGGDAYKIYLLNKTFKKSIKKTGQLIFVERFLGVMVIGVFLSILGLRIETPFAYYWNVFIFCLGIISVFIILKLLSRLFFIYKKRIYWGFFYSIWVQLSQLICVFFILKSFSIEGDFPTYMFIFLISSLLSVISFAGVGVRETVFYYSAFWFDFNQSTSASIALSFSLLTALVSFCGIFFMNNTLQKNNPTDFSK